MRVTVFDDDGNELAQGLIRSMKLDGRTREADISAIVMPMWQALPEGGKSATSVMDRLMNHMISGGKSEVSYSWKPKDRPQVISIESTGLA